MRLGQLARKYSLKQEQIIDFLENHNPGMGPYHNNTKLSDQIEDLIASHFDRSFIDGSSTEETVEDATVADNDVAVVAPEEPILETEESQPEADIEAEIQAELDPSLPAVETVEDDNDVSATKDEPKAIETDKLIELLESEEEDIDLSDIKLIKAPKKELEGLKVVGKIDLPEAKPKQPIKSETESVERVQRKAKGRRRPELTPEEKEKRRLNAKKKKEAYEARQEKKRQEDEAKRLKERKKAHYEQKIKPKKALKAKKVSVVEQPKTIIEEIEEPKKSKSVFGRYWAWFWHGEKL